MNIREHLLFALTGWVAGIIVVIGIGYIVFPAVVAGARPLSIAPNLLILTIVLLIVSPAALVGGLIGGRMPREGGRGSQILLAVIMGIVLAMPFSCLGFWYTGW